MLQHVTVVCNCSLDFSCGACVLVLIGPYQLGHSLVHNKFEFFSATCSLLMTCDNNHLMVWIPRTSLVLKAVRPESCCLDLVRLIDDQHQFSPCNT